MLSNPLNILKLAYEKINKLYLWGVLGIRTNTNWSLIALRGRQHIKVEQFLIKSLNRLRSYEIDENTIQGVKCGCLLPINTKLFSTIISIHKVFSTIIFQVHRTSQINSTTTESLRNCRPQIARKFQKLYKLVYNTKWILHGIFYLPFNSSATP